MEIIIIMLGFDDARANVSPEDTVTNISKIATVLTNMGKKVYVIDVPTHGDLDHLTDKQLNDNARRNEMIKTYLSA